MKLDSYYFSFESSGDSKIDLILSAVANAGKYYHSTENWGDEALYKSDDDLKGRTPIDWIQNAANDAAAHIDEVVRSNDMWIENVRLRKALGKIADMVDSDDADLDDVISIARSALSQQEESRG